MSINRKDHVSKLQKDLDIKDRQLFELNKELGETKEEITKVRNVNQMLRDSILAMKKEIREMLHKYL